MATVSVAQSAQAIVDMRPRPGRAAVIASPGARVSLVASKIQNVSLASTSPIISTRTEMDGVPSITVSQFQRVTMVAYVKTKTNIAITQATTQNVSCALFRPSVEGGEPIDQFYKTPADSVYDTIQYTLDPDGYNVEVEFEMSSPDLSRGGSTYQLEAVVELTSGEMVTLIGRVVVNPVLSQPPNAY